MTEPDSHGHSKMQTVAVWTVLPLWAGSVVVTIVSQIVGFPYAAPAELNLAGTAVLGFVLARTQAGRPKPADPPPPAAPPIPAGAGE